MRKIKRNSKGFFIVFGIVDGLLVFVTFLLLFFSLAYQGNLAPKLFSHRVYIMDTEAFSLVKKGSAVIADQVDFSRIMPGNIIIFTDEAKKATVGEVQKSDFENNVYTFTVKNDAGNILTVGQSRILGKGMYYSEFLGGIISFATSPSGVLCIAVLPCAAFIIWEIITAVKRKAPQSTVETVKKQYETPTYIPAPAKKEKNSDDETRMSLEDRLAFSDERQRLVEAAGLYDPSTKKTEPVIQPSAQPRPTVNAQEIDKLIRQAKAGIINNTDLKTDNARSRSPSSSNAARRPSSTPVNVAKSAYRQAQTYQQPQKDAERSEDKPVKAAPMSLDIDDKPLKRIDDENIAAIRAEPKHSRSRSSPRLSRLDSLLQEETTNDSKYDINSILRNMEKK